MLSFETLMALITAVLGSTFSILFSTIQAEIRKKRETKNDDVAERIKIVAEKLLSTSDELNDVQMQLEKRIIFVNEIKAQAEEAEQLLNLRKSEVDAIRTTLAKELKYEGKISFWKGVAVNFLFFIGGSIVSLLASNLFKGNAT